MQCIGFGDADRNGHRIFTFKANVDGEMRLYQIEAATIGEAQAAIERSLDSDEMQNLGAVGGASLAVIAVIVGGVVWVAHKLSLFKPAAKGTGKISNGSEISAPGEEEKAPPTNTGVRANMARAPQWRGINYGGEAGLMAGDNPLNSLRVVVYADGDPSWLLPLARPASYDMETGTLRDGIVVMQFPTRAASVRHPGAVEVFVGESPAQGRTFDVTEKDPQAALVRLRKLLTPYA